MKHLQIMLVCLLVYVFLLFETLRCEDEHAKISEEELSKFIKHKIMMGDSSFFRNAMICGMERELYGNERSHLPRSLKPGIDEEKLRSLHSLMTELLHNLLAIKAAKEQIEKNEQRHEQKREDAFTDDGMIYLG